MVGSSFFAMAAKPKPTRAWWIDHPKGQSIINYEPEMNHTAPHSSPHPGKTIKQLYGMDDEKFYQVDVRALRFSQWTCKDEFKDGEAVLKLVADLFYGKVQLSAPFLCLSVFESTDPRTKEPILKCINNRRLYALKEYAKLTDYAADSVKVTVRYISKTTVQEVLRYRKNSDPTRGLQIQVRKGFIKNKKK